MSNHDSLESILTNFESAIPGLRSCYEQGLRGLHECAGQLEAHALAGGMEHFAAFARELLSALQTISRHLQSGHAPGDDDLSVLEFLLLDVHGNTVSYSRAAKERGEDHPDIGLSRRNTIQLLSLWRPSGPTKEVAQEAPVEPAPAKSEPAPVCEAPRAYRGTFLICVASHRHFAVPIEHVMEIIKNQPLTPLPLPRPDLRGLLNLRGETLPVLDLRESTVGTCSSKCDFRYVIVSDIAGKRFGFEVDDVLSVAELDPSEFQPLREGQKAAHPVSNVSLQDGKTILILDIAEVLAA